MVAGVWVVPESDFEYTQGQLLDETLGVAHDELIMLIISLAVVIQIVANFNFLKRLPGCSLILSSFALVALLRGGSFSGGISLASITSMTSLISFGLASNWLADLISYRLILPLALPFWPWHLTQLLAKTG